VNRHRVEAVLFGCRQWMIEFKDESESILDFDNVADLPRAHNASRGHALFTARTLSHLCPFQTV